MYKRREQILSFIMLTIGATLAAFSMEEFLVPNSIFDGGVAGVAMISEHYLPIPLGVLVAFMNLPFLIVAYNKLGHGFVIKAGYSMLLFSILLVVFRNMAEATEDLLLATVFGGALLGVGVGLVLRGGGCLDGTEIVGILVSRRSDLSIGKIVLTTNTPAGNQHSGSGVLFYQLFKHSESTKKHLTFLTLFFNIRAFICVFF